jgi:hypothetical protein
MRNRLIFCLGLLVAAGAVFAMLNSPIMPMADAAGKPPVTTPTIECAPNETDGSGVIDVTVCAPAGGTGLPAGFSIQWMTCDDFAANGNAWYASDDPRLCKASFSGNASGTNYNLAAGTCLTVHVGNFSIDNQQGYSSTCEGPLNCNTCYVFQAFGHATSKYNKSANAGPCATFTDSCPVTNFSGCTKSIGYFRNQGSTDGTDACALASLGGSFNVGPNTYTTVAQIVTGVTAPNGSNLSRQALGLKLNIALSDGGCPNYCDPVYDEFGDPVLDEFGNPTYHPYPSGFGDAVLCGIDSTTPLTGTTYFPASFSGNGLTVQDILDQADGELSGVPNTLGLTAGQLGDLCALLNLSFDGAGSGTCCGASAFGENHLFTGGCP